MRYVTLALVQFKSEFMDIESNITKAIHFIEEASVKNADLIVFPELFLTGYNPKLIGNNFFDLSMDINGDTLNTFCQIAKERKINMIIPTIVSKGVPGVIYNSAVVISGEGKILGLYDKTHLWAGERFYFKAGDEYPVFDLDFGRIGLMICYDGGFPEVSRALALKGAELIIAPSAFPIIDKDMWDIYFKTRALENTCFVAGINRVGIEGDIHLFGNNKVANPRGKILLDAQLDEEEMQIVRIDLDDVKEYRKDIPYLRDRKPHSYILN